MTKDIAQEYYEPWYCETVSKTVEVSLMKISFHPLDGMNIYVQEIGLSTRQLKIHFEDLPIATRITNESQRLISLNRMPKGGFLHFIYIVKNSCFISWINSESRHVYENAPWLHLSVWADDEWIDLITVDMPEITVISNKPDKTC